MYMHVLRICIGLSICRSDEYSNRKDCRENMELCFLSMCTLNSM